tara:strand:+ start:10981 stop:12216 length:1236 start_codon:yes stop_codon:yes gene_type:complete
MSGLDLNQKTIIDIIIVLSCVIFLTIFFHRKILTSNTWRAIGTPMASIIGSGFLIVAPLLWVLVGPLSLWVLSATILLAYSVGSVIRYNIRYTEPLLKQQSSALKTLNHLSILTDITLAAAYFISIVFYIQLLSTFALKFFDISDPLYANILGTFLILGTGVYGKLKGFDSLETLEIYAVNFKISIILVFIIALIYYDSSSINTNDAVINSYHISMDTLRRVGGMFLIVQGFETSRYLGNKYDPEVRIKTMRMAQIISSLIYLVFVYLSANLMTGFSEVSETLIIDVSRKVSILLPIIITLGALASQYSSSIADMIGCGGIIKGVLKNKTTLKTTYIVIALGCILCLWTIDVFQAIALASRAFAFYYFLQSLIAFFVSRKGPHKKRLVWQLYILFIATIMLMITLFSLPMH